NLTLTASQVLEFPTGLTVPSTSTVTVTGGGLSASTPNNSGGMKFTGTNLNIGAGLGGGGNTNNGTMGLTGAAINSLGPVGLQAGGVGGTIRGDGGNNVLIFSAGLSIDQNCLYQMTNSDVTTINSYLINNGTINNGAGSTITVTGSVSGNGVYNN